VEPHLKPLDRSGVETNHGGCFQLHKLLIFTATLDRNVDKMLIHHPFWAVSAELVPNFYVKKDVKNRYTNVNGGFISRACSHGLIQYFPMIARVHLQSNVNKMLTEKIIVAAKSRFE